MSATINPLANPVQSDPPPAAMALVTTVPLSAKVGIFRAVVPAGTVVTVTSKVEGGASPGSSVPLAAPVNVALGPMIATVPAGTVVSLETVSAVEPTFCAPENTVLIPAGTLQVGHVVSPPPLPPPPITIVLAAFVARFTAAEQSAIMSNAITQSFVVQLMANTTIDVTNAQVQADMAALVTAGVLTSARSAQILNLAVASP